MVKNQIFAIQFQLAKVYGKVFSLRVGSEKMIIVSGYKMVKEALVTQNDSFVLRPPVPLFHKVYKGIGRCANHNGPKNKFLILLYCWCCFNGNHLYVSLCRFNNE